MPRESAWRRNLQNNLKCLEEAMQSLGMTPSMLALELGVNQGLLDKVLAGSYIPSETLASALADRLGLNYFDGRLSVNN